jgi:hypothetical protein
MYSVLFEDLKSNPIIEVVEETKISDRKVDLTAPEQMIIMVFEISKYISFLTFNIRLRFPIGDAP